MQMSLTGWSGDGAAPRYPTDAQVRRISWVPVGFGRLGSGQSGLLRPLLAGHPSATSVQACREAPFFCVPSMIDSLEVEVLYPA